MPLGCSGLSDSTALAMRCLAPVAAWCGGGTLLQNQALQRHAGIGSGKNSWIWPARKVNSQPPCLLWVLQCQL